MRSRGREYFGDLKLRGNRGVDVSCLERSGVRSIRRRENNGVSEGVLKRSKKRKLINVPDLMELVSSSFRRE